MKQAIKSRVPASVLEGYHGLRRIWESWRNAKRSTRDVFASIYRNGTWGDESGSYCSGAGSRTDSAVQPYVASIANYFQSLRPFRPIIVDLGCGDFRVGQRLLECCSHCIAVDVVPDLIEHLKATVHDPRVEFRCLDMIEDALPAGDVCFLRQVLQHLSNAQIRRVLPKLRQYRMTFITEHQPSDRCLAAPNQDKVQGSDIRLFANSGVYLDRPPFVGLGYTIELMLEAPGHDFGPLCDPGVIRTYRLEFPSA